MQYLGQRSAEPLPVKRVISWHNGYRGKTIIGLSLERRKLAWKRKVGCGERAWNRLKLKHPFDIT